jgi:hypothetical protein
MLLREDDRGVLAIGQPSHAWLSGQLARAWGNARFQRPALYEEVCLAADQHDIGWAMWDLEPARDPETGLPYSFMAMPLGEHLALWSAAPGRLLAQSRYAALLVSMHGSRLYRRRDLDSAAVRNFLEEQERFQERLKPGFDPGEVGVASDLIWTWDFLSLAICLGWAPRRAREVPTVDGPVDIEITARGARRVALRPWPFDRGVVAVRCEARRLTGRYGSDGELREALGRAPWETIEFELLSS